MEIHVVGLLVTMIPKLPTGPYWCDCIVLEPHPMGCQPSACRQGRRSSWGCVDSLLGRCNFHDSSHMTWRIGLQLIRCSKRSRKRYVTSLYRLLFTYFKSFPWRCIIKLGRVVYLLSRVLKLEADTPPHIPGPIRILLSIWPEEKLCKFIHII